MAADVARLGKNQMSGSRDAVIQLSEKMRTLVPLYFSRLHERIGNVEEKIQLLHPDNILKRGYSITRFKGKAVSDASKLKPGDEIVTQVYKGEMRSRVEN